MIAILLLLSGCGPVVQTEACAAYVECLDARDAALGAETDALRFEPTGACWGSAEGATLCTNACERGLTWLRDSYDDLPAECAQ